MKFLGVSGVFDYAGLSGCSRYRACSCCLPHITRASASGLTVYGAEYPPRLSSVYASLSTSRYPAQDSRPSGSLLLSRKALSSSASCRLSGKAMARTGLRMMPTFPSPPLKFRTAGFPQYGFKAGLSEGAFPARRPIVAPLWFASLLRAPRFQTCLSPRCVGAVVRLSAAIRASVVALPQGSSLRSGLFCPGPSTLNRPHPPQWRAHLDFAALRFIRDALAVHVPLCLGDPPLVLSFR